MKQKSHSGLKKRVKVRSSGTAMVQKSCRNHLLDNKSKGQKKLHSCGMPLEKTKVKAIKKLLPGKIK